MTSIKWSLLLKKFEPNYLRFKFVSRRCKIGQDQTIIQNTRWLSTLTGWYSFQMTHLFVRSTDTRLVVAAAYEQHFGFMIFMIPVILANNYHRVCKCSYSNQNNAQQTNFMWNMICFFKALCSLLKDDIEPAMKILEALDISNILYQLLFVLFSSNLAMILFITR